MNFPMHQDSAVDIDDTSLLLSKPCIRRSNRERKQTVTIVAESYRRHRVEKSQLNDIGVPSTSLLFSPPTKKRKIASAKTPLPTLVTPPSSHLHSHLHSHSSTIAHGKRADNSLAYLAYRFSQYIQVSDVLHSHFTSQPATWLELLRLVSKCDSSLVPIDRINLIKSLMSRIPPKHSKWNDDVCTMSLTFSKVPVSSRS